MALHFIQNVKACFLWDKNNKRTNTHTHKKKNISNVMLLYIFFLIHQDEDDSYKLLTITVYFKKEINDIALISFQSN